MDTSQFVTKQGLQTALKATEKRILQAVGELISDALQVISERFDRVEARLDRIEARLDNLEDKQDRTSALVDLHSVDIRQLKRKAA